MGLFSKFKKSEILPAVSDSQLVAVGTGKMLPPEKIADEVFAQEMMGQTIAFDLDNGEVVSPCNGKLEVFFPTGHAFAVRMNNGQGVLVHIGINTVNLNGRGFKVFAKQGDVVKAGQKLVTFNPQIIQEEGLDPTVMLIVTEPAEDGKKENYIPFQDVKKGQPIN